MSFAGAHTASADVILNASERGAYTQAGIFGTGGSGTSGGNYLTGADDDGARSVADTTTYNSFFVFSLAGVTSNITNATLTLNYAAGGGGGPLTVTLGIFDFTGSISNLIAGTGGVAAFNDLGSGIEFASATESILARDPGNAALALNGAALTALNAAEGGQIALGGSITDISSIVDYLFGASENDGDLVYSTQLDLAIAPTGVPEPATLALFGAGLLGFGFLYRRRTVKRAVQ